MLAHLVLPCVDMAKSAEFYETVLAPLGVRKVFDQVDDVGFGVQGQPDFWLEPLREGQAMRELHIAFMAPDRAAVDAFFRIATELGAEVLHEPHEWPEYDYYDDPVYYAAFVRDPDGNNVEAVCHATT